jgi:antitoxin component of RelBE/YafQ-DinJ toxin-antitoxin module
MNKLDVFNLRLDPDVREEIDERASEAGITSSEWIRCAIDNYLENEGSEIPSREEIVDMNREDLEDLVEDLEMETDPKDFDNSGVFGSPSDEDTEELRNAILVELNISDDSDSNDTE